MAKRKLVKSKVTKTILSSELNVTDIRRIGIVHDTYKCMFAQVDGAEFMLFSVNRYKCNLINRVDGAKISSISDVISHYGYGNIFVFDTIGEVLEWVDK